MNEILEQVMDRIGGLMEHSGQILVAIDGNCTAGKTTLASYLSHTYDCNVFHMDDFFLRPHQRTQERYAEIGGNVDYERFQEEVLLPLRAGTGFSYRPFDCNTFELTAPVFVTPKTLNIIEGTYSLHPYFGDVFDLKIFLSVTPQVQRLRILDRPSFLHDRFFEEWIPMEERYFHGFGIREKCDLVIR